jgi:hypothetical protein
VPEQREDPAGGDTAELEAALRRLGQQVDVPTRPPYAARVQQQLQPASGPVRHRARRPLSRRVRSLHPLAAAAVVLLVVVSVVIAVPAGRQAVADLFGIAGVEVHPLPSTAPAPRTTLDPGLDLGDPVSLAEARRLVSFPVAVPSAAGLDRPDAIYVRRGPGLESVTLVYRPRAGFPAAIDSHVGLLLSEYAGTATPYFDKYVDQQPAPTRVMVAGRWPGLYFPGPQQVFVRDPGGEVHEEHPRLSAPTLVWVRGAVTYRLEATIDQERALDVAASLP